MQWYEYNILSNYGFYPDPFGPYPKPDANIECPANIDVTSLANGIVTGVVDNPSWGVGTWSVTIKLDTPVNDIATHEAYNFLSSVNVSMGDRVQPGTIIGKSSDTYGFGLAFALTNDDVYGTTTFLKYAGDTRLDPMPVLNAAIQNKPQPIQGSGGSIAGISTSTLAGIGVLLLALVGIVLFVGFIGLSNG